VAGDVLSAERQGRHSVVDTLGYNDEVLKGLTPTLPPRLTLKGKRGAGGGSRTLTGLLSPADFLTDHGFRRPDGTKLWYPVCGLDYPFTFSPTIRSLGAARLVSTPSWRSSRQAWLGIAT
jgi:hypothetical protein